MTWLAIRANEEEVRTALQGAGIEVIETGTGHALGGFLEGAAGLQGSWAMVFLRGAALAPLVTPADAAFVALFEGALTVASDKRLFSSLVNLVTARVDQQGGCILDLREFGLGADTAKVIAERAGLVVSIGLKAVYTPRPDTDGSAREARTG
jgi:hypothetical protein